VLDGEIVCLDNTGQTNFENLLFRRGEPRVYAFDLLSWEGEDLRYLPREERKLRLRAVLPQTGERLLYCDHVELAGEEFFWLACQRDLEGIVAKCRFDPYLLDGSVRWYKVRNRQYSQWVGREELFERERETDPEFAIWNSCVKVCDSAENLIDAY
jgi:bifunctional non-homologous end joining protein LigD